VRVPAEAAAATAAVRVPASVRMEAPASAR